MQRARDIDPYDNPWMGMDGLWYWYDETSDEHGPFETLQTAVFVMRAYARSLDPGIPRDRTPWVILHPIELLDVEAPEVLGARRRWRLRDSLRYAAWIVFLGALGYVVALYFSSPTR